MITIYESSSQFTSHTRAGVNPPLLSSLIRNQILEFRILSLIECSSISNQDSLDPSAEFGPQTDRPKFSGADLDFRNSPKPTRLREPSSSERPTRGRGERWYTFDVHIRRPGETRQTIVVDPLSLHPSFKSKPNTRVVGLWQSKRKKSFPTCPPLFFLKFFLYTHT